MSADGRRGTKCGGGPPTCLYCRMPLVSFRGHEHDHFPIAYQHGGAETHCVCLNCHDLKDRGGLLKIEAFDAAVVSFSERCDETARTMLGLLTTACMNGRGMRAPDTLEEVRAMWKAWDSATGLERIVLAFLVTWAHGLHVEPRKRP